MLLGRPTVSEMRGKVARLRATKGHGVGGHLHIVLDDGNVEDHHVDFCLREAIKDGCTMCREVASDLLSMSKTQRSKLSKEFYGLSLGSLGGPHDVLPDVPTAHGPHPARPVLNRYGALSQDRRRRGMHHKLPGGGAR